MRPAPHRQSLSTLFRRHHGSGEDKPMPSPGEDPIRMPSSDELKRVAELAHVVGEREGLRVAVAGGLAMILYGSPRLTKDVDVVSRGVPPAPAELTRGEPLSFGGYTFGTPMGIDLDWIVRDDDYRALYEEALHAILPGRDGFLVVQIIGCIKGGKFSHGRSLGKVRAISLARLTSRFWVDLSPPSNRK